MAYEGTQICIHGLVSGEDLSASTVAFKFVKADTVTGLPNVVLCDAITDDAVGVLQAPTPTSAEGQPVQVVALGITKVQTTAAATVGDLIGVNGDGRGVPVLWGTDTTQFILGRIFNQDATGVAGSLRTAFVNCINPPKAVTSA